MVTKTLQKTNFGANFKQLSLEQAVAQTHNKKYARAARASSDRLRSSNLFSKVFVNPSGLVLNLDFGASLDFGGRRLSHIFETLKQNSALYHNVVTKKL